METPNQNNTTPHKLATKYIKILDKPREPNSCNQRVESKCTSQLMSEVPIVWVRTSDVSEVPTFGSALPTPTGNELQVLK